MSRQVTVSLAAAVVAAACLVIVSIAYVARAGRGADGDASSTDVAPSGPKAGPRRALELSDDELTDVVDGIQVYTMAKELGLTEAQLVGVLPKWRELAQTRRAFWVERGKRLERLSEVLNGGGSDEAISMAVESFRGEDEAFWSGYRRLEGALLGVLSPEQRGRYLLLSSDQPRHASRLLRLLKRARDPDGAGH